MRAQEPYGNLCRTCGEDFGSVSAFDAHRVGKHDYTYSEGVAMQPMRENGRRCLSIEEMEEKGFARNSRGRWSLVGALEAARKVADANPSRPTSIPEAA